MLTSTNFFWCATLINISCVADRDFRFVCLSSLPLYPLKSEGNDSAFSCQVWKSPFVIEAPLPLEERSETQKTYTVAFRRTSLQQISSILLYTFTWWNMLGLPLNSFLWEDKWAKTKTQENTFHLLFTLPSTHPFTVTLRLTCLFPFPCSAQCLKKLTCGLWSTSDDHAVHPAAHNTGHPSCGWVSPPSVPSHNSPVTTIGTPIPPGLWSSL